MQRRFSKRTAPRKNAIFVAAACATAASAQARISAIFQLFRRLENPTAHRTRSEKFGEQK